MRRSKSQWFAKVGKTRALQYLSIVASLTSYLEVLFLQMTLVCVPDIYDLDICFGAQLFDIPA